MRLILPEAPPICVEVLSPTNTKGEIEGKRELYFERGAREVWVCDLDGKMAFYNPSAPNSGTLGHLPKVPSSLVKLFSPRRKAGADRRPGRGSV